MSEEKKSQGRLKAWWERQKVNLQHTYRLVILKDDTFEEVGSYRLTLLNFYLALSAIIVFTAFIVILLFAFTPIKQYLPGYMDEDARNAEVRELSRRIKKIERQTKTDSIRLHNVLNIFAGRYETADNLEDTISYMPDSTLYVEKIPEDAEVRKAVEDNQPIVDATQTTPNKTVNFAPTTKPIEQLYFVPPTTGDISYPFKAEEGHYGVDVLAPKDTPIKAVLEGTIIESDWTIATGNTIAIQHSNNIVTYYKHNSALLKKVGEQVKAGEAIAIIGNTGTLSDGPHVHFELWYDGRPVNPVDYISFN